MVNIFDAVDRFFVSLRSFDINYNILFIVFISLFLFTIFCVIIVTAKSYESKLTKSIDMFNNYFLQSPNITEENLVAFNNKMKSRKVPKQLRKQWQQFVLYREAKASDYMSFENCVTNQTENSSFKRAIKIMNILSYIFATAALLLNIYVSYDSNFAVVLQKVILAPAIILLLNFIVTIFLNLRHNAVVTDLYQNYQYFEVNIDKATQTLPEYVDYEVLFDRAEIKRGIPILYSYLQKRAEEEKRELELARLKNVEHEKFSFDEAGVAGSLVLERAMQEAENYIAERKKYNQDTEQINSDITQEETNFREITKEYNRQMQVSKETFANFKAQLEDASSSIEVNYIKKQQQQELDRQRNLERDYDTATERHKSVLEGYQRELDGVDKFRAQSRKVLEEAMMSEFETYSSKVYDEAKKIVEEREKEKYEKIKNRIVELEEKLVNKEQELEKVYSENHSLSDQLEAAGIEYQPQEESLEQVEAPTQNTEFNYNPEPTITQSVEEYQPKAVEQPATDENFDSTQGVNYNLENLGVSQTENYVESQNATDEDMNSEVNEYPEYSSTTDSSSDGVEYDLSAFDSLFGESEPSVEQPANAETENNEEELNSDNSEDSSEGVDYDMSAFDNLFATNDNEEQTSENVENNDEDDEDEESEEGSEDEGATYDLSEFDKLFSSVTDESEEDEEPEDADSVDKTLAEPVENNSTIKSESEESGVTKRKAGRPRKEKVEVPAEPKKRGRPRKVVTQQPETAEKKKRGRPRKTEETAVPTVKKGRGRPKKVVDTETTKVSKRGRPKKEQTKVSTVKRGRGRPKKSATAVVETKKKVGRPKLDNSSAVKAKPKAGRGRPKKQLSNISYETAVKRGRPSKSSANSFKNIDDIDAYLKEIDDVIAQENAKFEASKKELEQKAKNIKKRK